MRHVPCRRRALVLVYFLCFLMCFVCHPPGTRSLFGVCIRFSTCFMWYCFLLSIFEFFTDDTREYPIFSEFTLVILAYRLFYRYDVPHRRRSFFGVICFSPTCFICHTPCSQGSCLAWYKHDGENAMCERLELPGTNNIVDLACNECCTSQVVTFANSR